MRTTRLLSLLLALGLLAVAPAAAAGGGGTAVTKLHGYNEVPALASQAQGDFSATISADESEITWQLSFRNTRGTVTQAHLHFAQKGVNGGIMIFLCSNLGNGPAGTQACPTDGTISGTVHAENVIGGAAAQGVNPEDLAAVVRGIKQGVVYANVHSTAFPGGEARGQLIFTPAPPPAN